MNQTIQAILLASLISTDDPHADSWAAVQWAREESVCARDLGIDHAVTDLHGYPIVDAYPSGSDAWVGFVESFEFDTIAEESDVYTGPESSPVTLRSAQLAELRSVYS